MLCFSQGFPSSECSSQNTQMSKEKAEVVIDVHEPDELMSLFLFHEDVEDVITPEGGLESADVIVNGVGFERKTPSDFASSITDEERNIYDQVQRMTEMYDESYVLLQGNLEDFERLEHSDLPPKSLRGATASITARYCPVIPCGGSYTENDEKAMELLVDMAMRIGRKHTESAGHHFMKTNSAPDDAPFVQKMLASIDGVGPELSKDIASVYDTPESVMAASVEDFKAIEGIGSERAKQIHETLHEGDDEGGTKRVIV